LVVSKKRGPRHPRPPLSPFQGEGGAARFILFLFFDPFVLFFSPPARHVFGSSLLSQRASSFCNFSDMNARFVRALASTVDSLARVSRRKAPILLSNEDFFILRLFRVFCETSEREYKSTENDRKEMSRSANCRPYRMKVPFHTRGKGCVPYPAGREVEKGLALFAGAE